MKRKHITDNQIKQFFWEYDNSPLENKASYLLGDLTNYGVSRCIKCRDGFKCVYYEFDIYREGNSVVTLMIQLPIDFKLKDVVKI